MSSTNNRNTNNARCMACRCRGANTCWQAMIICVAAATKALRFPVALIRPNRTGPSGYVAGGSAFPLRDQVLDIDSCSNHTSGGKCSGWRTRNGPEITCVCARNKHAQRVLRKLMGWREGGRGRERMVRVER
jgi:hypothetical protein